MGAPPNRSKGARGPRLRLVYTFCLSLSAVECGWSDSASPCSQSEPRYPDKHGFLWIPEEGFCRALDGDAVLLAGVLAGEVSSVALAEADLLFL